ncbi:MAG: WecB/TagA/CpsF family glycosyltransferase [Acidobacteria bacterium]|nr:WecB/TagA/CpsF family glycosyltransferase [Acidobacteriota bacterium]
MERVDVLGVPVDPVTVDQLHDRLRTFIQMGARATVLHANVHAVNLACTHAWFARILQQADLVFCDGAGVQLGARILGQRLPMRITYADWMWQLAAWCDAQRLALFLIGAERGVADLAATRLRARHPDVRIVGTHHGFFDKTPGSAETMAAIRHINAARPDIVIVGFGMPAQERWVHDHRSMIDAPVVLTGGAAFDYVSGRLRRAPAWMTGHGLEWLGRLAIEPRRLMSRYVAGNPLFLARVLRERLRRRSHRGQSPG